MSLIVSSAKERKRQLVVEEELSRATGKGDVPYTPGEKWRNNKMYLVDDAVKDANGKAYTALQESRNKPPANNPEFWKLDEQPSVKRWSDIPVGAEILKGTEVIHNSKNWHCLETHIKTAGNAPRQGSTLWEVVA